jgi:hypothetical protein
MMAKEWEKELDSGKCQVVLPRPLDKKLLGLRNSQEYFHLL